MSLTKIIVVEDYLVQGELVQGERKDQPSGWCDRN